MSQTRAGRSIVRHVQTQRIKQKEPFMKIRVAKTVQYEKLQIIGGGGSGIVYVVEKKGPVRQYAFQYELAAKLCLLKSAEDIEKDRETREEEYAQARENHYEEERAKRMMAHEEGRVYLEERFTGLYSEFDYRTEDERFMTPKECLKEINVLIRLQPGRGRHKHVINLIDAFKFEQTVWIVSERLAINLRQLVVRCKGARTLSIRDVVAITHEIVRALRYLKQRRVIHRDIKSENVLLSKTGKVKLCDFGLASVVPEHLSSCVVDEVRGTQQFMAPELFHEGRPYSYSVDIWALGIVIYCMWCEGEDPHLEDYPNDVFDEKHWRAYAHSEEAYIISFLGHKFLTPQELRKVKPDKQTERNARRMNEKIKLIAPTVRACLVPYPKRGLHNEVDREDLKERISLEELYQWTLTHLKGENELLIGNRIMRLVEECLELPNRDEEDSHSSRSYITHDDNLVLL